VPVTICLVVGLLVIQNIISPRVLGSAVGMNPILVLAAVFVGAQVAGALGGVFGVPVLAVFVTLFNAWLDQVRPPAAIDSARDRPLLPSEGGEKVGQDAILEAAEEEAAKARADLEEARDRIEELEAELKGRPVKPRDKGGANEDRPLLPSEGGQKVGQEAILEAAEEEAAKTKAEVEKAQERIAELEEKVEEKDGVGAPKAKRG
jgi:peptidoglycan hydrolase CwlO-like protein